MGVWSSLRKVRDNRLRYVLNLRTMFSNPNSLDRNLDEGRVLQVDANRLVCRVKTTEGKILDSVQVMTPYGGSSRYGDRFTPKRGDRVVVSYGLGYPVIQGFLPRQEILSEASPSPISSNASVDTGSYMPATYGTVPDPFKPGDFLAGDRVIVGDQGNMLAVLKGGSLLMRASRLSEIFLSKLSYFVRIVSKNWAHYSDSFSDIGHNISNRLYRYTGYSTTFSESLTEGYRYHNIYGDVSAGEALTTKYDTLTSVPSVGPCVFKEKVTDNTGSSLKMYRTVGLDGTEEVYVTDGTNFTRMKATNGVLTFSFKDQHTITVDSGKIDLHHSGGAEITLDGSGIRSVFGSGEVNMSSSSMVLTYSGGVTTMNASQVSTTFGGHFVTVSASGVALG